jgi:ATP-binding cassette, subfamily F, member 3
MLRITDLSYSIDGRSLIENANAVIPTGHKVGLVGRNGTGKTTLFKMIRGELTLDTGSIELPRGWKIGGVSQEVPGNEVSLIDTVLMADKERHALLAEAETATDPARIADIQTRLTDIDAWSAEARAASILKGLGFTDEEQRQPCSAFSGGWRMRVALAAVLFAEPDLLLLDEPTNYLDLEGALWLEAYLVKYPHTVVIVSHDRELLNRSVGAILHLEDKILTYYTGPYDSFARQRAEKRMLMTSAAKKQDAKRAHLQAFVDRFKAKASKAKQAQSRVKMLEKMETIRVPEDAARTVFHLPQARGAFAPDHRDRGGSGGLRQPHRAARPEPADRPRRPDRASGPQRRGQIDPVQDALGPARRGAGQDDLVLQAADRLFRTASGGRALRRRNAAAAPDAAAGRSKVRRGCAPASPALA